MCGEMHANGILSLNIKPNYAPSTVRNGNPFINKKAEMQI